VREGWVTKPLWEIASFQGGSQPPKSKFVSEPRNGYVRLLQIRDFKSEKHAVYVPISPKNRTCVETDIMIGRYGASVGQIHRGKAGAYNVALIKTIPDESLIDREFFYLYLNSSYFQTPLASVADRSAQAGFSKEDISDFKVPLPPLPEQQRIVAILDEAFVGLATATANAEKNLKNARELFESSLNLVFAKAGDDWKEVTLGEIAEFKNGLNFTKSSKGETIRIVGVKDFQNNFWVPAEELEAVQIEGGLSESYLLRKDDIITVRSNGNKQLIGRTMLAADVPKRTSHSGFTIRIRITNPNVNPVYLVRYLKSDAVRKALVESGDGAQISNLNQRALTGLPAQLPAIEKQQAIADELGVIEVETDRLKTSYEQKVASLLELKQSILQKAFSGELTSPPSQALREAAE